MPLSRNVLVGSWAKKPAYPMRVRPRSRHLFKKITMPNDTYYGVSYTGELVPPRTGLLIAKPRPQDWVAGGESGIVYEEVVSDGDWTKWLPSNERQSNTRFDTFACVSYSLLNSFETQMNRMTRENIFDIHEQQKLQKMGFIDDQGNFNCSDRFLAKVSNTGPTGNYLNIVADTLRTRGAVPESDWPFPPEPFGRDKYYAEIPIPVLDRGLELLDLVNIKWEWVEASESGIQKHLKQAPLQIATPVCPGWSSDNPVRFCSLNVSHATILYRAEPNGVRYDFDHYPPFRKSLSSNYPIPFVLKLVVSRKAQTTPPAPPPDSFSHLFVKDLYFGERSDEVRALQDVLKRDGSFPTKVRSTGYYGNITVKAVLAFQKRYSVVSFIETIRYRGRRVEKRTREALNNLFPRR